MTETEVLGAGNKGIGQPRNCIDGRLPLRVREEIAVTALALNDVVDLAE